MRSLRLPVFAMWLLAAACFAQTEPPGPQIDVDEVIRRGDLVVHAGDGFRAGDEEAAAGAVSLPADDSHKWHVILFTSASCPPCDALKHDWQSSPYLLAFARPNDPKASWAHFAEISADDATQRWRLSRYRVTSYPTIVLQPPRNGAYGDPATVVFQRSGYDSNPSKLSAAIAAAIRDYVSKLSRSGQLASMGGHGQVSGYSPPDWPNPVNPQPYFSTPTPLQIPPGPTSASLTELRAACPGADADFLLGQLAAQATTESARQAWSLEQLRRETQKLRDEQKIKDTPATPSVAPATATPLLTALLPWVLGLVGVGGLGSMIALGLTLFRSFRTAAGQKPLLNQEQFDALTAALRQAQTPPSQPTAVK